MTPDSCYIQIFSYLAEIICIIIYKKEFNVGTKFYFYKSIYISLIESKEPCHVQNN